MLKHIYLDKTTIFFLLIIILTGNFNHVFPYFSLLMIHEMGHALCGVILGYELDKITIYPYGGVTTFNLPINIPLKKELLILLFGPIFQIIGYFFLKSFKDISLYHYTLLIFNLLPIYPLDGGRILNILLGYVFNYLKSFYITFILSLLFITNLFLLNIKEFNLTLFMTLITVLGKLINLYKKRYLYYNRFLLERYLYNYIFKKVRIIKNVHGLYRDTRHFINYEEEKRFLKKYFERK